VIKETGEGRTGEEVETEGAEAGVAAGGRKTRGGGEKGVRVEAEVGTEEERGEAGVEKGIVKIKRDVRKMKRGSLREWRRGRRKVYLPSKMVI